MPRNYDELISAGNKAQLEKLKIHKDKPGNFEDIDLKWANKRIGDELWELSNEVHAEKTDYCKIRHEAADIANFAHMIILRCDKEIADKKGCD
jgi:hypothetical protein